MKQNKLPCKKGHLHFVCLTLIILLIFPFNLNAETLGRKRKVHGTYDEYLNRQYPYTFFTSGMNTSAYIDSVIGTIGLK